MSFDNVEPREISVPPTKHSSNSNLPVLHYPQALSDKTLEGSLAAIEPKGWFKGGHWKIADVPEAATPHYHSTTHECYTALKGKGVYCLGKSPLDSNDEGFSFVGEGDVFAFPAGVTHNVVHTKGEYEIVGYFALSGQNTKEAPYDMEFARDSPEETEKMREKCRLLQTPAQDPVHGPYGPMRKLWAV